MPNAKGSRSWRWTMLLSVPLLRSLFLSKLPVLAFAALIASGLALRAQVIVTATYSATAVSSKPEEGAEAYQLNFGSNGGTAEAGGQRSNNGDNSNQRSSRTFVEFQVTSDLKSAAASGSAASLSFNLTGITNGAGGLPALSLVLLANQSTAFNGSSNLASLWNGSNLWTAPVTTGVNASSTGLVGTTVVSSFAGADLAMLLSTVASANVSDYVTLYFTGGPRRDAASVTDSSGREVYELSSAPANFALSITPSAIPEPSTYATTAACLVLVCAVGYRRRGERPVDQRGQV